MDINELLEDMKDAEKALKDAEGELGEAQEWLLKMKVQYAEAVIRYHNAKKV